MSVQAIEVAVVCNASNDQQSTDDSREGTAMKLTLDLTPDQGARLFAAARTTGIDLSALVTDTVPESEAFVRSLVSQPNPTVKPVIDAENAAAIALLNQWIAEDATDDPEEIRLADEEVAELKRNLNANRVATGERLVGA
jgi:hypothetical protein